MAAVSLAAKLRPSPLQMTRTPGPAAMRASNASPTTIITWPPPELQTHCDLSRGRTGQRDGILRDRLRERPRTPSICRPFRSLAFGDDRRRGLALTDLGAASDAEKRENNGSTERELFHICPLPETSKMQDRRGFQGPLVQKRHTSQLNRCCRTSVPGGTRRRLLYGVQTTATR